MISVGMFDVKPYDRLWFDRKLEGDIRMQYFDYKLGADTARLARGLDVYEEETDLFFEDVSGEVLGDEVLSLLLTLPNVLITSHQGFLTHEALEAIAATTLENIRAFFAGRPQNLVLPGENQA